MFNKRIRFEIDGDRIKSKKERKTPTGWEVYDIDSAPLKKVVKALMDGNFDTMKPVDFYPRLPDGIDGRILSVSGLEGDEKVIVELPPLSRPLVYEDTVYQLAFPWIIFVLEFDKYAARVYFRNEQMSRLDDPVYLANFTNAYGTPGSATNIGMVCMEFPSDEWTEETSLPERVGLVLDSFWRTSFNADGDAAWDICKKLDNHPKSRDQWQSMTQLNPDFILKIDWPGETTLAKEFRWIQSSETDTDQEDFESFLCDVIFEQSFSF